jgi:hypothetical protein
VRIPSKLEPTGQDCPEELIETRWQGSKCGGAGHNGVHRRQAQLVIEIKVKGCHIGIAEEKFRRTAKGLGSAKQVKERQDARGAIATTGAPKGAD